MLPPIEVGISDGVRLLVAVTPTLTDIEAAQLARLLAASVSAPSSALIREARLGLLIDVLGDLQGELIDTVTYDAERAARRNRGETWPVSSTLIRLFGSWHRVLVAAMHLAFDGTVSRRPSSMKLAGYRRAYTRKEALKVIIEMRRVLGVWPTSGEYLWFRELCCRAATVNKKAEPRIPSMTPLNRLFGGYAPAITAAQAKVGEVPLESHDTTPPCPESHSVSVVEDPAIDVLGLATATSSGSKHAPGAPASEGTERLLPNASIWWKAIRHLSVSDRHLLWITLVARNASPGSVISEQALNAIRLCASDCGGAYVSRDVYDAWRKAQPRPDEWPSSRRIRAKFKSWLKAIEAAGLQPTPDVLAQRLSGRNPAFTLDERIAAVNACAVEWKLSHPGCPLRLYDYVVWAKAQMRTELPRFERLPLNNRTLTQYLTWNEMLAAAGHADLIDLNRMVHQRHGRFSDEELLDWLCGAAEELAAAGLKLTSRTYDRWAQALEQMLRTPADPTMSIPRSSQLVRRFGGWPHCMYAAGLITDGQFRGRRRHLNDSMTRAQLITFLANVLDELGDALSCASYDRWRNQRREHPNYDGEPIPSSTWLRIQLGDGRWNDAKATARRAE